MTTLNKIYISPVYKINSFSEESDEPDYTFKTINWDFTNVNTSYLTHGLHPYPAKFIPQIPNALISELSNIGETILDIFSGSGTTLVEALALKRNAIGIDANPLACLISDAKTTRLHEMDETHLRLLVGKALTLAEFISEKAEKSLLGSNYFASSSYRPATKAISFWFEPFVVEELAEALSWCRELPTESSKKVALVAFSAIIVTVSKQDSDTRYVRRNKNVSPGDTLRRFARSLTNAIGAVREFTKTLDPHYHCSIYQANILTNPDITEVDLVVCSPPYPNAYSYHLYHMTRMLWLGMDQPKFKQEEIGSHRKYSKSGPNAATTNTFRNEMSIIFKWLHTHLRDSRYACFIIGDSTIKGKRISNVNLISEVACKSGFKEVARINRRLQETKKAFNPAIGKIKEEQVLILQNNKKGYFENKD